MLDLFLKLTDKIIQLLKEKQYNKDRVFKEIIDPIFKDMEIIAKDYFTLFNEIEKYSASPESDVKNEEVVQSFKKRRYDYLHLRIKVCSMVDLVITEFEDEDIHNFAKSILEFHKGISPCDNYGRFINEIPAGSSISGSILIYIYAVESKKYSKQKFSEYVKDLIEDLKETWNRLSKQYAVLRVKYLKP